MANINIDDDLYEEIKEFSDNSDPIEFPSLKNAVEKMLKFAIHHKDFTVLRAHK